MAGRAREMSRLRKALAEAGERLGSFGYVPTDPVVIEEHRTTVLWRTRVASYVALFVMPVTIFWYAAGHPRPTMRGALTASLLADAGVLLVLLAMRTQALRRFYHLPFFLLVGVVCSGTNAVLLQLTGGAAGSNFLFPYFLILFGVATLFPARLGWAVAAAAMAPLSFLISELWVWGRLGAGQPGISLLLLSESALIAVIGNRVTTRAFLSEVEHRRAVERANERLRGLDKAKSDFFANLSHDLRTPLNVIIGPVQVVQRSPALDGRSRRYLEMALRGARRLDAMINDLLDLARIEAGVVQLNLVRLDLGELIGSMVEGTSIYARSLGQQLTFEAAPGPCVADVDPDKVERVVANLVSNALKFSPAGSEIRVWLTMVRDTLRIAVQDQGPGIPAESRAVIFDRFARLPDATGRRPRGAGIGLAVAREFVELHGGRIWVESVPGEGATFFVELPRTHGAGAAVAPAPALPPAADVGRAGLRREGEPARVLLVEDDDETRVFLSSELSQQFEVLPAADGETALRLADEVPDVVLLDLNLPRLSGLDVCRLLRRNPLTRGALVIAMSAQADRSTRVAAFEAGADDFLHKPLAPPALKARMEALLRGRSVVGPGEPTHP